MQILGTCSPCPSVEELKHPPPCTSPPIVTSEVTLASSHRYLSVFISFPQHLAASRQSLRSSRALFLEHNSLVTIRNYAHMALSFCVATIHLKPKSRARLLVFFY